MPYLTPGERLVEYLRRTSFAGLQTPAFRNNVLSAIADGQREVEILDALDDIAVLNVARRLIIGASWAREKHGAGPVTEDYVASLIVNELLIDYANVRKLRDYVLPCAEAARSKVSPSLRREILETHGLACYMCGTGLVTGQLTSAETGSTPATIDHVWPRGYGGDSSFSNLLPACEACNVAKDSMATWPLFRFQYLVLGPFPREQEAAMVGREARIAWQLQKASQLLKSDRMLSLKDAVLQVGPVDDIDFELRNYPTDFFTLDTYSERVGA